MNLSSSLATISSSFKLVKAQLRMSFHHTHILFIDGDPHLWKNQPLSLLLFLRHPLCLGLSPLHTLYFSYACMCYHGDPMLLLL